MPLVEQELLTLPDELSSPSFFKWESLCSIFSFLCCVMWTFVCIFILFSLVHCMSAILRITDSDYRSAIFNFFFLCYKNFRTLTVFNKRLVEWVANMSFVYMIDSDQRQYSNRRPLHVIWRRFEKVRNGHRFENCFVCHNAHTQIKVKLP